MDATRAPDPRCKILILEQDEYLASLMHLLLHREGHAITAITCVDALELHMQSPLTPMMFFVSHCWLRGETPPILQTLKAHPHWQQVPLIMLMNYFDLDLIERVTEWGVCDYLLQPFEPVALLNMIQKHSKSAA